MSLVNDALRRAREVRPPTHSPLLAQMQFRPVEPVQYSKRRIGVVMPVAAIVVAVVALFFTWRLARVRTASAPRDALASAAANLNRPGSPLTPSDGERVPFRAGEGFGGPVREPPAGGVLPPQAAPHPPPQPAHQSESVTKTAKPEAAAEPRPAPSSPAAVAKQEEDANPPVEEPPARVFKLPPLKLQAIVLSPKRPWVLINGRTMYLGETMGDMRLVAIDRSGATLVGRGQTNSLTLAH